jgi:hypothetical protein
MTDLVSGRYPQLAALNSILGLPSNVVNPAVPARTNLEYTGINGLADTTASLVTQVMTVVPVPVDVGTVLSKVSVFVGGTGAGTPTHSFAAIYAGTNTAAPALLGQSTDGATAAIAASGRFDFTLATPILITPTNAPYGYIFVAVCVTATTVPSLATVPNGAAAVQYAWYATTPGASFAAVPGTLAFSAGSGLGATAPTTLVAVAAKAVAPVVVVS